MAKEFNAPGFLQMVRGNDPNITEADAQNYVDGLVDKKASSGCYVIKCMKPCKMPVACAYNMTCGWCLWPGISTIPFGCCMLPMSGSDESGRYGSCKNDMWVLKVDDENETLACFPNSNNKASTVCCYCNKL